MQAYDDRGNFLSHGQATKDSAWRLAGIADPGNWEKSYLARTLANPPQYSFGLALQGRVRLVAALFRT
jgi:hypothetical protein